MVHREALLVLVLRPSQRFGVSAEQRPHRGEPELHHQVLERPLRRGHARDHRQHQLLHQWRQLPGVVPRRPTRRTWTFPGFSAFLGIGDSLPQAGRFLVEPILGPPGVAAISSDQAFNSPRDIPRFPVGHDGRGLVVELNKLAPRLKHQLTLWGLWPLGGVVVAWLGIVVWDRLFLLILVWAGVVSILLRGIRCPSCEKPVAMVARRVLATDFGRWRLIIPRVCDECGAPLDRHMSATNDSE